MGLTAGVTGLVCQEPLLTVPVPHALALFPRAATMVIASGTPEEVAATPGSYTGAFLAELLEPAPARVRTRPSRRRVAAVN